MAILTIKEIMADQSLAVKVQEKLINLKLLAGTADGKVGKHTLTAIAELLEITKSNQFHLELLQLESLPQSELNLSQQDFAAQIAKYMLAQNYWLDENNLNIIYVEGCNLDGTLNNDLINEWNDIRLILKIENKIPKIIGQWKATTEPGLKYTINPLNPDGAFRIAFGQHKAWSVGYHKGQEALVQVGEIVGHRDKNKDGMRTGDRIVKGSDYGVNQHAGGNSPTIGGWSAGCLVGQSVAGHQEFMKIVKTHPSYQAIDSYIFLTTILPGDKLNH